MIKWLVKRCILRLLADDTEIKMALTKVANPELHWEIKYGDMKNPPPRLSKGRGWWNSCSQGWNDLTGWNK